MTFASGYERKGTPSQRFWWRVVQTETCWLWSRGMVDGYGRFWDGQREWKAHVFAWVEENGPVPAGLELDHLCRVRNCVRPDHLEAVTHRVNTLRGETITAEHARKTKCPSGHPYDDENTRVYNGRRHCRTCDRIRLKLRRATA